MNHEKGGNRGTMMTTPVQGSRDKRRHKRGYKSYRMKYGLKEPEHQAYARRPSEGGLFISTNMVVYPVGSLLVMELDMNGTVHRVNGVVRHCLKTDPRFAQMSKPGMGIEFIDATPELKKAICT
jgi:hypothetical protein